MISELRVSVKVFGNTLNAHKEFMNKLCGVVPHLKILEGFPGSECDCIFVFIAIGSRAGTDVTAALNGISNLAHKPVILVSLHHTFDPNFLAPVSRHIVYRDGMLAVDCLFHEHQGLLNSSHNDTALRNVAEYLRRVPSNRIPASASLTNTKKGGKTEPVSWIIFILSIVILWAVLPVGYSFFTTIVFQIFLLIAVSVTLNYFDLRQLSVWIVIALNTAFIIKFAVQSLMTDEDLQRYTSSKNE